MDMDVMIIIPSSLKPDSQHIRLPHNEGMGYSASPSNEEPDTFGWPNKTPFSWKQIVWGATIPISVLIFYYGVHNLTFIQYRPWIAIPSNISLQIIFIIGLVLYSVSVCKKQGYWPLIRFGPISSIISNFLKSCILFLLVGFTIGIIWYIIKTIFSLKIEKAEFVKIASYGPSSLVLILFLFFGFTILPFIEELFYRGFLYNALKTKTTIFIATIIQSALFSVTHRYDLFGSFIVFLDGIALAIIYEKKKDLIFPAFIHCIGNAFILIPLLILTLQNYHIPASTMEEARKDPAWLLSNPPSYIQMQKNGMDQWQYTINTWGSKGTRQWKKEANAFHSVSIWFPEDQRACAKAKLGIVTIYLYYLQDYRRAICEAEQLLVKFPNQEEECAIALSNIGKSYYLLKDFQRSRQAFENVLKKYNKFQEVVDSAEKGLIMLQTLNGN